MADTTVIDPIKVFISCFAISSFAGLAALLRTGKKITTTLVISAVLNSGLIGLCVGLLWYTKFQDNIYFLVGVCTLAGLGGATTIDFALSMFKSALKSKLGVTEESKDAPKS
jgi:hypothetical protein